jgi:hypothetical protein
MDWKTSSLGKQRRPHSSLSTESRRSTQVDAGAFPAIHGQSPSKVTKKNKPTMPLSPPDIEADNDSRSQLMVARGCGEAQPQRPQTKETLRLVCWT